MHMLVFALLFEHMLSRVHLAFHAWIQDFSSVGVGGVGGCGGGGGGGSGSI